MLFSGGRGGIREEENSYNEIDSDEARSIRAKVSSIDHIQKQFELRKRQYDAAKKLEDMPSSQLTRVRAALNSNKITGLSTQIRETNLRNLAERLKENLDSSKSDAPHHPLKYCDLEDAGIEIEYQCFTNNKSLIMYRKAIAMEAIALKKMSAKSELHPQLKTHVPQKRNVHGGQAEDLKRIMDDLQKEKDTLTGSTSGSSMGGFQTARQVQNKLKEPKKMKKDLLSQTSIKSFYKKKEEEGPSDQPDKIDDKTEPIDNDSYSNAEAAVIDDFSKADMDSDYPKADMEEDDNSNDTVINEDLIKPEPKEDETSPPASMSFNFAVSIKKEKPEANNEPLPNFKTEMEDEVDSDAETEKDFPMHNKKVKLEMGASSTEMVVSDDEDLLDNFPQSYEDIGRTFGAAKVKVETFVSDDDETDDEGNSANHNVKVHKIKRSSSPPLLSDGIIDIDMESPVENSDEFGKTKVKVEPIASYDDGIDDEDQTDNHLAKVHRIKRSNSPPIVSDDVVDVDVDMGVENGQSIGAPEAPKLKQEPNYDEETDDEDQTNNQFVPEFKIKQSHSPPPDDDDALALLDDVLETTSDEKSKQKNKKDEQYSRRAMANYLEEPSTSKSMEFRKKYDSASSPGPSTSRANTSFLDRSSEFDQGPQPKKRRTSDYDEEPIKRSTKYAHASKSNRHHDHLDAEDSDPEKDLAYVQRCVEERLDEKRMDDEKLNEESLNEDSGVFCNSSVEIPDEDELEDDLNELHRHIHERHVYEDSDMSARLESLEDKLRQCGEDPECDPNETQYILDQISELLKIKREKMDYEIAEGVRAKQRQHSQKRDEFIGKLFGEINFEDLEKEDAFKARSSSRSDPRATPSTSRSYPRSESSSHSGQSSNSGHTDTKPKMECTYANFIGKVDRLLIRTKTEKDILIDRHAAQRIKERKEKGERISHDSEMAVRVKKFKDHFHSTYVQPILSGYFEKGLITQEQYKIIARNITEKLVSREDDGMYLLGQQASQCPLFLFLFFSNFE